MSRSVAPLDGVRVIDMSRLLPGPFCSQMLCDMGAEVIKVEDSEGGDYSRYFPPLADDGNSAVFHALNRGKKSILLNLKEKTDVELFKRLLATADVLIESFRPGVLNRLGLGVAELRKQFPRLIICSISGYGQTGPDCLKAGHDINYLARAGVLGVMAEPRVLPVQVADLASGAYPAAIQILGGLYGRSIHGSGCVIDVSMVDNSYLMLTMPLARYFLNKETFGNGKDMLCGRYPCYDVYRTKDGYVSVGNLEQKFWKSFVLSVGLPSLVDDAYKEGEEGRRVRHELQQRLAQLTNQQLTQLMQGVDTCVEIVRSPEDRLSDPQLAHRSLTVPVAVQSSSSSSSSTSGEKSQSLLLPRSPLCMSGVEFRREAGPLIGQHTDEILAPLRSKL